MLNVSKLCSGYGAIRAVKEVDLIVEQGKLVTLIGPNGAGKSTFVNTISGLLRSTSGTVTFLGQDVTKAPAHKIIRSGLALVPEGRHVVAPLTVAENMRLSSYGVGAHRGGVQWDIERVYDLFPQLGDRREQVAGLLSGGEQQMLALGRALLTNPRLLLLDEPSMGLALSLVDTVFDAIIQIHHSGTSVLLIEQNVSLALSIADYGYIMQRGRIVLEGSPVDLRGAPELLSAYLG